MKKLFVIAVLLYLCITINAQVLDTDKNASQNNDLSKAFDKSLSKLEEERDSLRSEIIKHPGSLNTVEIGFIEIEVQKSYDSIRKALIKSLDDPQYEGLKNQVGASFPQPALSFIGIKDLQVVVSDTSVERGFTEISNYIKELKEAAAQPRVTLNIRINNGAIGFATFKPTSGSEITVTGLMPNIIRKSYFKYSITKPGYKEIIGVLNLRDTTPTALDCTMFETTVTNNESSCTIIF